MSTNTDGTATVDETIRLRDVIIDAVNRRNDGYNHALSILCYQLQTILNLQTDKRCLKFVKAIDKLIEDMRVNPRKEWDMGLLDQNGLLQLRMEYQKAQEEAQVNGEQLPPFEEWAKQYLEQPKGMIQKWHLQIESVFTKQ